MPARRIATLASVASGLYQAAVIQSFVDTCLAQPSAARQRAVLATIVDRPRWHARWLNTLARLEYVGVRKMLKARRSETLDLDGLRHILEEAAHATRLKKAAVAIAADAAWVETFAEEHTLCGDAAEQYFQNIDREAARLVADEQLNGSADEVCYVLTSAAIELRARSFYPDYQAVLERAGSAVSVASIIGDEQEHLEHMAAQLPKGLTAWQSVLTRLMVVEEASFHAYLDRVEAALQSQ